MDSIKLINIQDYIDNPISIREFFDLFHGANKNKAYLDTSDESFPEKYRRNFTCIRLFNLAIVAEDNDFLNRTIKYFEVSKSSVHDYDVLKIVLNEKEKSALSNNKKGVSLGRLLNSIKTVKGYGTYLNTENESFPKEYRAFYIRASHLYNLAGYYSDQNILDRDVESLELSHTNNKFDKEFMMTIQKSAYGEYNNFIDYLDRVCADLDSDIAVSIYGTTDIINKITTSAECTYHTPSNIGSIELDFVKTVVNSEKRVYEFIACNKLLNGNSNLIVITHPRYEVMKENPVIKLTLKKE